jgi:hypothetical protein
MLTHRVKGNLAKVLRGIVLPTVKWSRDVEGLFPELKNSPSLD